MTTVALKGLMGRKLRAALTAVAIVLGVAMVSGTYVLTDTITAAFNTLFTQVYEHTDAVITGKSAIGSSNTANGDSVPSFSETLLTRVRNLPGVLQAEGGIDDQSQLVGRNGKVIATHGPGLAFSVNPAGNQRFNPLVLTSGRWPSAPREIAIDKATADSKHFTLGDTIGVVARGPVQTFRIVGLVKFGGLNSLGGATLSIFDLPTAQRLFHKEGKLDSIGVAGRPNVTPQELVRQIRPILPPTAQVRTGQAQAAKQSSDTSGILDILRYFLLAFGGVALFVGAFVIANTLSITIAQRTRELATLRTLGATRRQVLASVMLEAFVIGLLASIAGLFLGLGLAKGLNALFVSLGIDLPQAGTVFATRTVVVSLLVGVLVTLIAASRPALRATRVPPISAVREGAVLPKSRFARFGPAVASVVIVAAVALMLVGLFAGGLTTKVRLLSIGVGAAAIFIGVAMLAPTLVPPLARVLGWPAAKLGGAAGQLARGNSVRNPGRTASTAAALMIGLALVTLVSVLVAGIRSTFTGAVNDVFRADYALTSQDNFSPISISSANALRTVPGVRVVSGVRAGEAKAFGSTIQLSGVAGDISRVVDVPWQVGSPLTPALLGRTGAFVSKDYAKSNNLTRGSVIVVQLPTGVKLHLRLRGIFAPPKGGSPFGDVTISAQLFDRVVQNPQNVFTFVLINGGVNAVNTARLNAALKAYPDAKLQTEEQFKTNQLRGLNQFLLLLYLLLSLSIVVSLFGIVNTLVLTVFERTRELGMLRAVGMTRVQLRRMIRHESVITALLGAALGIPLGIVLALMVGRAIKYPAFTIPWGTLIAFVVVAIVIGLIAAIFPARRAGKLNVLEALQYE